MSPSSPEDHHHHHKKKRVGKACDSCRIKKTKCDGKKPCSRCIADNKLCAFTEKKKHKEKTHPSGYIDLLETRLDLLTKSLEKIVSLAEPHLPFLSDLMARARTEHTQISSPESESSETRDSHYVPINEVVAYLISEMGLLDKEPVEWERGAQIAAKLEPANMSQSASDFALHKRATADDDEEVHLKYEDDVPPHYEMPDRHNVLGHSRASSSASIESPTFGEGLTDQLNLSISGFSASQLQHPQAQSLSSLGLEAFPKRATSLFINHNELATSPSSVSSLANRFESQDLDDPHRRRGSGSLKGPLSPSHQKMKHNGHVHKRGFQSHSHVGTQNIVSNNGNEFHFPKQYSSTSSLPDIISSGSSKNSDIPSTIFDDDLLFDDLPSRYDLGEFAKGDLLDGEEVFLGNRFVSTNQ